MFYFTCLFIVTGLLACIYFCKVINIYPTKLNTISLIQKYIFIFLFFLIVSVRFLLICWKRSSNTLFKHSVNTWYSLHNSDSTCENTYIFFPSLAINGSRNYLYDIYLIFAHSFNNLYCYVFFILILVSLQNHLSIKNFWNL